MESIAVTDYRSLDAEIQRAVRARAAFRAELVRDPDVAEAAHALAAFRRVSSRTTFGALAAHTPVSFDVPLRDALRRYVAELTIARVAQPQEVALAKAMLKPSAPFALGRGVRISFFDALRGVVLSAPPIEARAFLSAAAERGPEIASAARALAEVRFEAAQQLGLARPSELTQTVPRADLSSFAEAFLAHTDAAAAHVITEARAREDQHHRAPDPTLAIRIAVARDAREGWPARLTPRWFFDVFASGYGSSSSLELTRGLNVTLPRLPSAVGASSFARALASFGYALADAGAAASLPFVLGHDPSFVRAHRFALVFGALPTSESFQRRTLGLAQSDARDQARILARAALIDARILVARFLLSDDSRLASRDTFEELTERAFGAPLPPELTLAWPQVRGDEAAKLAALASVEPLHHELIARFDDDWFRNPRAAMHLRALASAPAREDVDAPAAFGEHAAIDLARTFEGAIA
jgi:hypothetical protein